MQVIWTGIRIGQQALHSIMHSKTFLLQSTQVSIDQFVIELWMSGSANLVCEICKV